ncbi:solute carrier family 52, riboflavin transporter, member 3-B [Chelonus insularis]|uniref:solute carrier family 52, riboflavin transporter, member 3-B n=1 Tax=Chelonus insularis TaxID=460826 RepID=UPI001588C38A|nr:solute carrier family 52, riboflavin transporter, member 3-B [Chelonus insularis]
MLSQKLSNRKLLVDVLAVMFGIGSWIGINGVFIEIPLLVQLAPEGWSLPAYIVMVVQIANLGPILYTLFTKYSSWSRDDYIIYTLLGVAATSVFILAFTYKSTSIISGTKHSTVLLSFMFLIAIVGCTSSVLFMPYMRNFREIYLISYLVGESLSGFLPSILALIQGVGGNAQCRNVTKPGQPQRFEEYYPDPRFSLETFFIILGTLLWMSFLSFIGLNKFQIALNERVKPAGCTETLPTDINAPPSYKTSTEWRMSKQMYLYLLSIMGIICFLGHTALASIQSYSCLPYGNIAYHLTVTLASMAQPLSMCVGFIRTSPVSVRVVSLLTVFVIIISSIILYLAVQSPNPPLQDSWLGPFIIVILWVITYSLIGFLKMSITTLFRPDPGRGLYYTGVATQVGSLAGAITSFALVNYTEIFKSYSPCTILNQT